MRDLLHDMEIFAPPVDVCEFKTEHKAVHKPCVEQGMTESLGARDVSILMNAKQDTSALKG